MHSIARSLSLSVCWDAAHYEILSAGHRKLIYIVSVLVLAVSYGSRVVALGVSEFLLGLETVHLRAG